MIVQRLTELGYRYEPASLEVRKTFHAATRVGSLVFTSGQVPLLNNIAIKGQVGRDIDLDTAKKAAEICAFNCFRAAGAIVDIESIIQVAKVTGMVNVAEGFNQTSEVVNGVSEFIWKVLGENGGHARSAVGMVLPANWAVEVEMVIVVG